jgi:hypothetical protein
LTVSPMTVKELETSEPIVPTITSPVAMRRRGVFGKSSGGYGGITHALRQSDIWAATACHSGDMGFELCYLPDMPAVLRSLAGAENYIERWWQQLEAAKKHRRVPAESEPTRADRLVSLPLRRQSRLRQKSG